jgi:hypothetical protein
MQELIHKLATAAVAHVRKDKREAEYNLLHKSMSKACDMMSDSKPEWVSSVMKRMAEQYTTFQGIKC